MSGAPNGLKLCSNVGQDPLIYIRYKIVGFVAICRFLLFVCVCVCARELGAPYGLKRFKCRPGSGDLHSL